MPVEKHMILPARHRWIYDAFHLTPSLQVTGSSCTKFYFTGNIICPESLSTHQHLGKLSFLTKGVRSTNAQISEWMLPFRSRISCTTKKSISFWRKIFNVKFMHVLHTFSLNLQADKSWDALFTKSGFQKVHLLWITMALCHKPSWASKGLSDWSAHWFGTTHHLSRMWQCVRCFSALQTCEAEWELIFL